MKSMCLAMFACFLLAANFSCSESSSPSSNGEAREQEPNTIGGSSGSVRPGESVDASPEATLRQFMTAMISSDKELLEKTSIPHEDLGLLLSMEQASSSQLEAAKGQIAKMPVTRLSVGESFRLPSGDTLDIDATMVNDKRQLLTFPGNPMPFILVCGDDDNWRVNPETVIATRKAAQAIQDR